MGKLLILAKYVFLIYVTDIYEKRKHVHVTYSHSGFKRACKFWLEPMVILASNRGIPSHELREVERLVYQNQVLLRSAYRDFHNR